MTAVCLFLVLSGFNFVYEGYFSEESSRGLAQVKSVAPTIANGSGLDVYNSNSTNESKMNAVIRITDMNEPLIVKVNTVGMKRNFVLKLFYDYKEIPFKVTKDGKYSTSYFFNVEDSHEIELPVFLSDKITKDEKTHKLVAFLYPGADIYIRDIKIRDSGSNVILPYDIIYDDNERVELNKEVAYDSPKNITNITFSGIYINTDYKNQSASMDVVKPSPYSLKVNTNQKLNLAYHVGGFPETDKLMLILTVGWKQWKMDGKDFKLVKVDSPRVGNDVFSIVTPSEPGLYEVNAFVIKNPYGLSNPDAYMPADASVRFTLEVE